MNATAIKTETRKAAAKTPRRKFLTVRIFSQLARIAVIGGLLGVLYWLFIASDRYVSEASVIIRKTDSISTPSLDITGLPLMMSGAGGVNRPEQLLLKEYMLSLDMLKKLDAKLNLREHYQDSSKDLLSRLWMDDMEWFYRHYLSRTSVEFDEFAGVLRLDVQAYDAEMAQNIANMLVAEGENYMNLINHDLAETQVSFLETQVEVAQARFTQASQTLLAFQNKNNLLSPQATADSFTTLIGSLEAQRAKLQTQLASMPATLDRDHPNLAMLRKSIGAIDRQITNEKAKLTNPRGKTLNITMEEFQRLQMEVSFHEGMYKAALTALEKGRIDATRMLEKVSLLQAPSLAEFPMQPRRTYNSVVTLLLALMLAGILKLLESIVLDHVD